MIYIIQSNRLNFFQRVVRIFPTKNGYPLDILLISRGYKKIEILYKIYIKDLYHVDIKKFYIKFI